MIEPSAEETRASSSEMSVHGPLCADVGPGVVGLPASDSPERAMPTSRRGLLGLAGVIVCGTLLSVAAAHTRSLLPETIRFVPPSLAGAFSGIGLNLHVGGAIAALTVMFVSYAVVVAASTRAKRRTRPAQAPPEVLLFGCLLCRDASARRPHGRSPRMGSGCPFRIVSLRSISSSNSSAFFPINQRS